jgi:geranylgeranyl diphosphate synthase type II
LKNYTDHFNKLRAKIEEGLLRSLDLVEGSPLKDEIAYVFTMGGKRIRPLVTILAAESVGEFNDDVLHSAVAIEILHNFTLVHDDIMDNAGTRRGRSTIHVKSGVNTAILVGDLMMALAYDCLEKCSKGRLRKGIQIFNEGVKKVCDGQALDESLSHGDGATMNRYIDMISKKTGALLMAAGSLGALFGGGTEEQVTSFGTFGLNLGIAFQILDDILDLEGDSERFGKPLGLDIIEKKKNFLYLKAQQLMNDAKFAIVHGAHKKAVVTEDDVVGVRETYRANGVFEAARKDVSDYTRRALSSLKGIEESDGKNALVELANSLVRRKF